MAAPTRILYVTGTGGIGGVETHLLQIAELLDRKQFEPTFLVPGGGALAALLKAEGQSVIELDLEPVRTKLLSAISVTRSAIGENNPRIIHAHTTVGGVVARLALSRNDRIHRITVFTHHGFGYRDLVRMMPSRGFSKLKRKAVITLEYVLDSSTDHLITVSRTDLERGITDRYLPHIRISYIPNGVIPRMEADQVRVKRSQPRFNSSPRQIVVGAVARLVEQKGIPDMLQAFAAVHRSYDEVEFVIVGGGPLLPMAQNLARNLGISHRTRFIGECSTPREHLKEFDIFVSGSLWEGCPYAILEAMSEGIPIVATAVNGVPELLAEDCGLLSPVRKPDRLAANICRLISDAELRSRLGENGLRACAKAYNARTSILRLEYLYRRLMVQKG